MSRAASLVMVILGIPALVVLACIYFKRQRSRTSARSSGGGAAAGAIFRNGFSLSTKDRKGFKPLRTDDIDNIDMTSESDNDDTLFKRTANEPASGKR